MTLNKTTCYREIVQKHEDIESLTADFGTLYEEIETVSKMTETEFDGEMTRQKTTLSQYWKEAVIISAIFGLYKAVRPQSMPTAQEMNEYKKTRAIQKGSKLAFFFHRLNYLKIFQEKKSSSQENFSALKLFSAMRTFDSFDDAIPFEEEVECDDFTINYALKLIQTKDFSTKLIKLDNGIKESDSTIKRLGFIGLNRVKLQEICKDILLNFQSVNGNYITIEAISASLVLDDKQSKPSKMPADIKSIFQSALLAKNINFLSQNRQSKPASHKPL